MSTNYTRWYTTGSVKVTKDSKSIVGTDTYWANAGLHPGDMFTIDSSKFYEIDTITDNTHITLRTTYAEATASGKSYAIIRNFTSSMQAETAANTAELLYDMRTYIDTEMETIHGKSAYEIAVKNGYAGTEQQWLNYLIGAGKWTELDTSTKASLSSMQTQVNSAVSQANTAATRTAFINDALTISDLFRSGFHNSIFRGKSLGTSVTSAQWTAIKNGTFTDMYIGDYWDIGDKRYRIAAFDYYWNKTEISGGTSGPGWTDINGDVLPSSSYVQRHHFWQHPHHIVVIPEYYIGTASVMNTEDTKSEPYGTCYWRLNERRNQIAILAGAFGAEHLMYWSDRFTVGFKANANGGYYNEERGVFVCQAELMSSVQLTGQTAYGSHGQPLVTGGFLNEENYGGGQFPLFRLCPSFIQQVNKGSVDGYANGNLSYTRDVEKMSDGKAIRFGSFYGNNVVFYHNPVESAATNRVYFCLMG